MALRNKINGKELKSKMRAAVEVRRTLSFYKYYTIEAPDVFRNALYARLEKIGVLGRIYVAKEGINAQISLPEDQIMAFKQILADTGFLVNVRLNFAVEDNGKSFFKLKIIARLKILADGLNDITFDSSNSGGHLKAADFNALIEKPDTVIVDLRNHFESEVGHFEGAFMPPVVTFRDSLPLIAEELAAHKDKNIVMYCTGGIRCEKASAWFKHQGFENMFQLEGGIIEYSRQCKTEGLDNKFKGVNFVFDERIAERISEDVVAHCHQCRAVADTHKNCSNDACHLLFIQCSTCADKMNGCCSIACKDFIMLAPEIQKIERKNHVFNGSKFGGHGFVGKLFEL